MSVTGIYWKIQTVKYWLGTGGKFWVNTYEIAADSAVSVGAGELGNVADALVQFEQEFHLPSVYFDRVLISSTELEGPNYDPSHSRVVEQSLFGTRTTSGQPLDLNAVFNVRRLPGSGRPGKLAYRGVLTEDDVEGGAQGFWSLDPASPLLASGATWLSAMAFVSDLLGGSLTGADGYRVCMLPPPSDTNPDNVPRIVDDFQPYGAGFSRFNHRYFDRA